MMYKRGKLKMKKVIALFGVLILGGCAMFPQPKINEVPATEWCVKSTINAVACNDALVKSTVKTVKARVMSGSLAVPIAQRVKDLLDQAHKVNQSANMLILTGGNEGVMLDKFNRIMERAELMLAEDGA